MSSMSASQLHPEVGVLEGLQRGAQAGQFARPFERCHVTAILEDGEAGVGYLLRAGMFLPPLMFNPDELEALVLGARWVRQQGDAGLAAAAANALAKIATATPRDLRDAIAETSLWVPPRRDSASSEAFMVPAREAIRHQHKLRIAYRDEQGAASERMVWPFALAFFEGRRILAAHCELRSAFRHFRIDRIAQATPTGERYPAWRRELLARWRAELCFYEDS